MGDACHAMSCPIWWRCCLWFLRFASGNRIDTRVLGGKGLPKNILVIYAAKEGEGICTVGLFSLFIPWFELGLGRMDGWTGGWMGLGGASWGIWSIWREEEKGASSRNIKKLLFACVALEKAIRIHIN